jgi:hypothetical protein
LEELRRTISESKATLKESTKAIDTCRHGLTNAQAAQKASQVKLNSAAAQLGQLQNVDRDMYQPLKARAAHGAEGFKQLKCIEKVGKRFGFPETLLESARAVLKKELDKRRTFDGLVMSELETQFTKNYNIVESVLKDGQAEYQEQIDAAQEAQTRVDEAERAHKGCSQTLAEARAALAPAQATLIAARRNVRRLVPDAQKAMQGLDRAKARLNAFRLGPLVAFEELQKAWKPNAEDVALEIEATATPNAKMQAHASNESRVFEIVQGSTREDNMAAQQNVADALDATFSPTPTLIDIVMDRSAPELLRA